MIDAKTDTTSPDDHPAVARLKSTFAGRGLKAATFRNETTVLVPAAMLHESAASSNVGATTTPSPVDAERIAGHARLEPHKRDCNGQRSKCDD